MASTTYTVTYHFTGNTTTVKQHNCYSVTDAIAAFLKQRQSGVIPQNAVVINVTESPL